MGTYKRINVSPRRSLEDVVRGHIYVTNVNMADDAMRAFGRHSRDIRPSATLMGIARLARPTN